MESAVWKAPFPFHSMLWVPYVQFLTLSLTQINLKHMMCSGNYELDYIMLGLSLLDRRSQHIKSEA